MNKIIFLSFIFAFVFPVVAQDCTLHGCFVQQNVSLCCFTTRRAAAQHAEYREQPNVDLLHDLLVASASEVQAELPSVIRGRNLTLDNLERYFTLSHATVMTQKPARRSNNATLKAKNASSVVGIDPGTIINIAKDLWDIIEANKPVVNVNVDYATATPAAAKDWTQLENWEQMLWPGFDLTFQNYYGMDLCSFKWSFIWAYHGDFNHTGQYITSATTSLVDAHAAPFFELDVTGSSGPPFNAGTAENPIAEISLTASAQCKGIVSNDKTQVVVNIRGDGGHQCVGGCQFGPKSANKM
eukprot:gene23743-28782_t